MPRNNPGEFSWDEAAIERLRVLWLDECKTSSEIGRLMGVSRNSIIGKTHRLGWSGMRQQRPSKRKRKKAAPAPRRKPAQKPQIPDAFPDLRPTPAPPVIGSYTLMDLKHGSCRWPSGEIPAEFKFCGAPKLEHSSYCLEHTKRSASQYRAGSPSYLRWAPR